MISEDKKIIPLINSADTGAGVDMDSFKALGSRVTVIVTHGVVTGNAVWKVYSGAAAGTKTSAMAFKVAAGGAAIGSANCDVLTAWTDVASTGLTMAAATYSTKMVILEIDCSAMDATNGEEWLTIEISSAGTNAITHAVAILDKPRYSNGSSATLLA